LRGINLTRPHSYGNQPVNLPKNERMKIFLQHKHTSLYFVSNGQWSKKSDAALDFPNYDRAIEFAIEHKLPNVHVILKFADHPYNIRLPFRKKLPQHASLWA
jgi:hypothetical protein